MTGKSDNEGEKIPKCPTRIRLSFALNNLRRALWEEALERQFDAKARKKYWNEFRGEDQKVVCFYCGESKPARWDHVTPVTKGGATIPGNLVPSCGPCDDSKSKHDLKSWLLKKHPKRMDEVLNRLAKLRSEHSYIVPDAGCPVAIWTPDKQAIGQKLLKLAEELQRAIDELKPK